MCGIAGWVVFDAAPPTTAVIAGMTATLARRGPDASGTWQDEHAALGHHRLAVLDPARGHQPMRLSTPRGDLVLTFGGEIYNFVALRNELRLRGHGFTTDTDTEVLLHGFLEWGEALPEKLEGMFAFGVWDSGRQCLTLVRDRLGVKPLYVSRRRDGVLFASEPKAILAHPDVTPVLDLEGLRRMLGYVLTLPGSVWSGIEEVEPGSMLTVDRHGATRRRYWRLPDSAERDDVPTAVSKIRRLLEGVVQRQLVADVPVGVLLSGGLDSSTLAALARAGSDELPLFTFSVDFAEADEEFMPDFERAAPDAPFVRTMVDHLGCHHTEVRLDGVTLDDPEVRRRAVAAYDVPPGFADRDRSMLLFFAQVREQVTVALSGESADELFGGYSWFHDERTTRADMFPWVTACLEAYGVAPQALAPGLSRRAELGPFLADEYATARAGVPWFQGEGLDERRHRVARQLHLTHELRVLLDRKDRLSMAAGLEVRVPYCDHRLVEYVFAAPWSHLTFDGREKSLLRAASGQLLPPAVKGRVKTAYPVLRTAATADRLRKQVRDLAEDRDHAVFALVDRTWLSRAGLTEGPLPLGVRNTCEWVLNVAVWLEQHRPSLAV